MEKTLWDSTHITFSQIYFPPRLNTFITKSQTIVIRTLWTNIAKVAITIPESLTSNSILGKTTKYYESSEFWNESDSLFKKQKHCFICHDKNKSCQFIFYYFCNSLKSFIISLLIRETRRRNFKKLALYRRISWRFPIWNTVKESNYKRVMSQAKVERSLRTL